MRGAGNKDDRRVARSGCPAIGEAAISLRELTVAAGAAPTRAASDTPAHSSSSTIATKQNVARIAVPMLRSSASCKRRDAA
jgi:hypothetical protein